MHDDRKIAVFLGPSFDINEARKIINADFHPPAQRGDFRQFCSSGHKAVVLIDGEMIYGAPPSPQESLDLMARGVSLYGAASLGALRGVELRDFGFNASGWVYEEYLSGRVKHDDELLSILDPETFLPLTIPLINVRYALSFMTAECRISLEAAKRFLSECRMIFFDERTEKRLKEIGILLGLRENLLIEIFSEKFNIKKNDAIDCLQKVTKRWEFQA